MHQRTGFLAAVVVAAGMTAMGMAGCELISTVDRSMIPSSGGAGTTGTTSTGGTGGATGTGGMMGCPSGVTACMAATDCPPTQNECVDAVCNAGCCGTTNVAANIPTATQTPGDCMVVVCDGMGGTMTKNDDMDVDDDMNACTADSCMMGMPVHTPIAGPCTANGGTVCGDTAGTNAGKCVQCNVAADCMTGICLPNGSCAPASCMDGVKNGSETDTDCGGGTCMPCADGKACMIGTDCVDLICDNTMHCAAASCSDHVQNGGESDVDCGAACPGQLCADGLKCGSGADCQSGVCHSGTCQAPTCTDGVKNGTETDTDCGGAACDAMGDRCAAGLHCAVSADCQSGVCTGGVCQAAACNDGVQNGTETDTDCGGAACDASGHTCATNQKCGAGADCQSGVCTAGKCAAPTCTDGVHNGTETDVDCGGPACDASGHLCSVGQHCGAGVDCTTGVCLGGVCAMATCMDGTRNGTETDVDCGGGACPGCPTNDHCLVSGDCLSGVCTGNVCQAPTCADGVKNGTETDTDCGGATCDAANDLCGTNKKCGVGADCQSGVCTGGVCQAPACTDGVKNGTETDTDCGGATCDSLGKTCANGKDCAAGADCQSKVCAGGVCQAPTCTDGQQNGSETDTDCGGATCDAGGHLCGANQKCGIGADCQSGVCTGGLCQAPTCTDGLKNGGETGIDCGNTAVTGCPACGAGQGCAVGSDCQSLSCNGTVCLVASCSDHIQNGGESDVDCGMVCVLKLCGNGKHCFADADCSSSTCLGGTCYPATCNDGSQDSGETDIDCGGGTCPGCASGKSCNSGTDCASSVCLANNTCM
jgi:hypothetical protein